MKCVVFWSNNRIKYGNDRWGGEGVSLGYDGLNCWWID